MTDSIVRFDLKAFINDDCRLRYNLKYIFNSLIKEK